jgi:nitrite reductase/ring-hydroxylating ferredoxin subunit
MTGLSKIRFFFLTCILAMFLTQCEREKNDVIPDEYVSFTIDLRDFPALASMAGSDTVDAADLRVNDRRYAGGFEGSGIIIYNSDYGYLAFDRTCPHDYVNSSMVVRVKIDGLFATCPECKTTYALPNNGMPYSGPGKYYLKNYKTSFSSPYLMVWNY